MPKVTEIEDDFTPASLAMAIGRKWAWVIGGLLAFYLLMTGWYTVDAGERAVLLRWGAVQGVTGPGLHFKLPFVESIERITVRTGTIEWTGDSHMESYSKDQQPANLSIKVTYHVLPDDASVIMLYTQFRDADKFVDSVIIPRTLEGVKTTFGQFNAVTAIQERTRLNMEIESTVKSLIKGPVMIDGVQVQDIAFSDSYEKAVEARMEAQVEVDRLAMNLERERKQAEIKIVQAHAEEERLVSIGRGQAAAIDARAKALKDNPELVALTAAEKWNGVLPTTMVPGGSVPFLNMK